MQRLNSSLSATKKDARMDIFFLLLNQRHSVATLTQGFSSWSNKKSTEPMLDASFCCLTRTRTQTDRTRICSATITPLSKVSEASLAAQLVLYICASFRKAGAKVLLFFETAKYFEKKMQKKCKFVDFEDGKPGKKINFYNFAEKNRDKQENSKKNKKIKRDCNLLRVLCV